MQLVTILCRNKGLARKLGITCKEISLEMEWLLGLTSDPLAGAALFEITGDSRLYPMFSSVAGEQCRHLVQWLTWSFAWAGRRHNPRSSGNDKGWLHQGFSGILIFWGRCCAFNM